MSHYTRSTLLRPRNVQGRPSPQWFDPGTGGGGQPGPPGPPGPIGPPGAKGDPGVSIRIRGTVPTEDDLPVTGVPGDAWIVDATGDLYVWEAA